VRDPQDTRLVLEEWLRGLDAILFVETPLFPGLCRKARELGVLVMCHPNWEWLHPGLDWLDDVDVMLAPTRRTASMLNQWKRQFGFRWIVEDLPWPIDAETFSFRRRYRAERFVYVHGSGGFRAFRNGVESDLIARKGLATLLQAVREAPQVPLIVYGDEPPGVSVPPNVEFRAPLDDNRELYIDGDICIQPSLWEGLGLPLLECQAAGMPLVTTDLPPMNEHSPFAVIPAKEVSACLKPDYWIAAADLCPDDIARVMRNTWRRWIPFASSRARRFIVREHNWRTTRGPLVEKISTWSRSLQAGH
jgi:glycosyltransferase involved in cell wall biosynthesis